MKGIPRVVRFDFRIDSVVTCHLFLPVRIKFLSQPLGQIGSLLVSTQ